MKNKFAGIQIGDIVNKKYSIDGEYKMKRCVVTYVGNTCFSVDNGIMAYSKSTGRALGKDNSIITHYID